MPWINERYRVKEAAEARYEKVKRVALEYHMYSRRLSNSDIEYVVRYQTKIVKIVLGKRIVKKIRRID